MSSNKLFVFVGESGCGKTSIVQALSEMLGIQEILSYTTRDKRRDQESGYHFVKPDVFQEHKRKGLIFESTEVGHNHYWTCTEDLDFHDERVLIANVEGVEALLRRWDKDRLVVIYVSSNIHDRQQRLMEDYWYNNRGGERYYHKEHAEDAVRHRMDRDKNAFDLIECDYVIQNTSSLPSAVEKALRIVFLERERYALNES